MKKFCEYLPVLTGKGFSLKLEDEVCTSFARSCVIDGSETWPVEKEYEAKLGRTEVNILRWMCGLNLKKETQRSELLGLEPVSSNGML